MDSPQIERIVQKVLSKLKGEPSPPSSQATFSVEKKLLTEADVLRAAAQEVREIVVPPGLIVTPLARDALKEKGIALVPSSSVRQGESERGTTEGNSDGSGTIALGADHGGYEMKEAIKRGLQEEGRTVRDFGAFSSESVDYPDFALKVAEAVADGTCHTGIMVDGTGFASAMVANKVPGILAATCWDLFTVRLAREHVGANVLTLGGKVIGLALALEMVKVWLETSFTGGRHQRRTDKIWEVEAKYSRK
ncbi:MAG: ribose 5-phosphate isomerase B [Candidatus Latescibacteria bacterium]|nr:ribose 5-phosphate isomerase B [Candidatus Latescibacterota bacterium]